ncbi:MAG: hypothetical protein V9E83_11540 [Baekduia sp.]
MALELQRQQWQAGERLLAAGPPEHRAALTRVTDAIVSELRRRLGGPFTVTELAQLYDEGTAWCTDLAFTIAPGLPEAWDPRITADAAFGRYARGASDYAGGRIAAGEQASN